MVSLCCIRFSSRPRTYSDLRMVLTGLWHAYLLLESMNILEFQLQVGQTPGYDDKNFDISRVGS
jgi:hypothetical protein